MNLFKKIVISTAAATALLAATSTIAGSYIYEYNYYATSAKVKLVGGSVTTCDGVTHVWGTVTEHKKLTGKEPCGDFWWNF